MSILQVYKVRASKDDEAPSLTIAFGITARNMEDAIKTAKIKAKQYLDKVASLTVSETEPEPKAKDHPGQTKIAGTEEA
jgi:mRNA-degrading endonuclease YafQ of YafQ-DinJ toxin-antitoxin module